MCIKIVLYRTAIPTTCNMAFTPRVIIIFQLYYLPVKTFYNQCVLPTMIASLPLVRHILIREQITIVHGHSAFSALAHEVMIIAKMLGIKVRGFSTIILKIVLIVTLASQKLIFFFEVVIAKATRGFIYYYVILSSKI